MNINLRPRSLAEIISDYTTLGELQEARKIYHSLRAIENEEVFAIALLYRLGIAEGKRIERARRRGSVKKNVTETSTFSTTEVSA